MVPMLYRFGELIAPLTFFVWLALRARDLARLSADPAQ